MKAIEQLNNEHEGIKIVFRILRKMCDSLKSDDTTAAATLAHECEQYIFRFPMSLWKTSKKSLKS